MSYIPPEILIIHHWHHFWKELELIYRRDFSHSVKISSHKPFYDWNKFTFHEMMKPSNLNILWSKRTFFKMFSKLVFYKSLVVFCCSISISESITIDFSLQLIAFQAAVILAWPMQIYQHDPAWVTNWECGIFHFVKFNIKFSDGGKLDFQLIRDIVNCRTWSCKM